MAEVLAEYMIQRGLDPTTALAKLPLTDIKDEELKEKIIARTKTQMAAITIE